MLRFHRDSYTVSSLLSFSRVFWIPLPVSLVFWLPVTIVYIQIYLVNTRRHGNYNIAHGNYNVILYLQVLTIFFFPEDNPPRLHSGVEYPSLSFSSVAVPSLPSSSERIGFDPFASCNLADWRTCR